MVRPLLDAVPTVKLLALVIPSDTGGAIARLTAKIERFEAGADAVDFSSDRDDELGALADAIDDVFYVLDAEGNRQDWNERLPERAGYSNERIESMHALDFYEGPDGGSIQAAIETGSTRVDAALRTADGDLVPHEFTAVALRDSDGDALLAGIGRSWLPTARNHVR
ncbi:PAS domain-containing protein [Natrinema pallidum]|uniref:PAS domain-containing protein n=1 Tax=Natrinema pallidum TaxID=69527 RepID=UPI0015860B2B|nr:PAS domain-containing protein [Natrinema pallidum]